MRLKIIGLLLLVSLLSGCGNESSPPSATNDSLQEPLEETEKAINEETISEKKKEVIDFVFQNSSITFPDGTFSNAKSHTLSTEGSVKNEELQDLIDLIEKAQIQEDGNIAQLKENSNYTGTSILFTMSNDKTEYNISISLREGNICNLDINSGDGDMKTYYIDSADVSDYMKKIVSYKIVDPERLEEVQSIEFAQTFQSSPLTLDGLESQKLISEILKCEKTNADEINAGIPIVIKNSNNDNFNGKVSPEGTLVAIEQTVYDTSALEELKDYLKNVIK